MKDCCKKTMEDVIKAYEGSFYNEVRFDFEGFHKILEEMSKGETHKAGKTRPKA